MKVTGLAIFYQALGLLFVHGEHDWKYFWYGQMCCLFVCFAGAVIQEIRGLKQ